MKGNGIEGLKGRQNVLEEAIREPEATEQETLQRLSGSLGLETRGRAI